MISEKDIFLIGAGRMTVIVLRQFSGVNERASSFVTPRVTLGGRLLSAYAHDKLN